MLVLPAIDLRDGRVVRLRQGRADDETVYDDDPAAAARRWATAGAQWLHVVDLDGAFTGHRGNLEAIRAIIGAADVPCEVGGGIRDVGAASKLLTLGAERVIFGTAALADPNLVARAIERFGPEHVIVGVDARDGRVATHGWTETTDMAAGELALRAKALGATRIVYTDIRRDGMSAGPNVEATVALARACGLRLIASGGVRSIGDIERLARHEPDGIEGVIVGRALYDGSLRLEDAIAAAEGPARKEATS